MSPTKLPFYSLKKTEKKEKKTKENQLNRLNEEGSAAQKMSTDVQFYEVFVELAEFRDRTGKLVIVKISRYWLCAGGWSFVRAHEPSLPKRNQVKYPVRKEG